MRRDFAELTAANPDAKAAALLHSIARNRTVTDRLAKSVRHAAQTKGRIDRNMQTLLSLFNLPSRADYLKLLTKVEALQGSIINLNIKLDADVRLRVEEKAKQDVETKPIF